MPTLLQDKVFIFAGRPKPSDSELEILQLICDQENLGPILSAETIKNGENYDSYKVLANDNAYLVKISLDDENKLGTEKLILDCLAPLEVAPKSTAQFGINFGDTVHYLITTWEDAQPIQELGRGVILDNQESLIVSLRKINSITEPFQSFQEYLSNLFTQTSFEKQDEFRNLVEKNSQNYQLLVEELIAAKQEISQNFKESYAAKTLIHGNLSENTILVGREGFKFINWENSFCAHPLFELAAAEMNLNLGENIEYSLVQKMGESWDKYLEIRNFWASVSLLKNVFAFIKEIFLYEGKREKEILELVERFYQCSKYYEKIPTFKRNREEILNLFNQAAF